MDELATEPIANSRSAPSPLVPAPDRRRERWFRGLVAAALIAGFIWFVLFARVTAHPFNLPSRTMDVRAIWRSFSGDLPRIGGSWFTLVLFNIGVIVAILALIACILFALGADAVPRAPAADQSPPDPAPSEV